MNTPLSSHHNGGVANNAFQQIAMNPEILKKVNTPQVTTIQPKPAYLRGQVYKNAKFDEINFFETNQQDEDKTYADPSSIVQHLFTVYKQSTSRKLTQE